MSASVTDWDALRLAVAVLAPGSLRAATGLAGASQRPCWLHDGSTDEA